MASLSINNNEPFTLYVFEVNSKEAWEFFQEKLKEWEESGDYKSARAKAALTVAEHLSALDPSDESCSNEVEVPGLHIYAVVDLAGRLQASGVGSTDDFHLSFLASAPWNIESKRRVFGAPRAVIEAFLRTCAQVDEKRAIIIQPSPDAIAYYERQLNLAPLVVKVSKVRSIEFRVNAQARERFLQKHGDFAIPMSFEEFLKISKS